MVSFGYILEGKLIGLLLTGYEGKRRIKIYFQAFDLIIIQLSDTDINEMGVWGAVY